jgi:hypothetical protein
MTTKTKVYSLEDFEKIIFKGLDYSLPTDVIHRIQDLKIKLSANTGQTTIQSIQSTHQQHHLNAKKKGTWIKAPPIPEFKATHFVEERNGLEKSISDIRVSLNKISDLNYEKIKENIVITFQSTIENKEKIIETILEITSSNVFLAKINAKLYNELMLQLDPMFGEQLNVLIQNYFAEFENAEIIAVENKRRKATTNFILHLFLLNNRILSKESLFFIMGLWLQRIESWANEEKKIAAVEELTEHFYIFLHDCYKEFSILDNWNDFYDKIAEISELKSKDFVSLSNRAIFKFRDLIDFI